MWMAKMKQKRKSGTRVTKKEYSDKLNQKLGLEDVLGRELDFTKLPLKDLLDLYETFTDPVKLKAVAVHIGSEFITGDVLGAASGIIGKEGVGGDLVKEFVSSANKEDVRDVVLDTAEEEIKERFPIAGRILGRARKRIRERREDKKD